MGKIKPNKSRREYNPEYFLEFNQMIEKLYEINKEYEQLKASKKARPRDQLLSIEEEEEEQVEVKIEPEDSDPSHSFQSEQPKVST